MTKVHRYRVIYATGQIVERTASSWADLDEELQAKGFRWGIDYNILPLCGPACPCKS